MASTWKTDHEYHSLKLAISSANFPGKERAEMYAKDFRPPMSPADHQVAQELQRGYRPIDILRRCAEDGSVSSHVVRLCLEAQWSEQASVPRKNREKVHALQRNDLLAGFIIRHILQNFDDWTTFIHRERSATYCLCYFAVIEGLEDVVLKWMEVPASGNDNFWRAQLFAGLCIAHDTLDTRESADRSLETFFKVTDIMSSNRVDNSSRSLSYEHYNTSSIVTLDPRPALLTLVTKLYDHAHLFGKHRTDEALYDRFSNFYRSYESKRRRRKEAQELTWDMSRLHLYHPRMMDPGPALDVLVNYAKDGRDAIASPATWTKKGLQMPVARSIRRTADIAEASGNFQAAMWIFKTFEKEFLMVKPMPWAHANAQLNDLGVAPSPMQQRLLIAATRAGGLRASPRPETVQVNFDSSEHAENFESVLNQKGTNVQR